MANGNLATAVAAIELVGAGGELRRISRATDQDTFTGSVVSLGALGVVTAVTLDVVPTYSIRQDVYEDLPWEEAFAHLDEVMADGYSVSLFTTWQPEGVDQVWRKRVVDPGAGDDGCRRHVARRPPRDGVTAPAARAGRDRVHPAARRPRSMARAAPALPPRRDAEQRGRAAVGVLRGPGARTRRPPDVVRPA